MDYEKCNGCDCVQGETCTRIRSCECDAYHICCECVTAGDPRKKSKAFKYLEKALKAHLQGGG